MAWLSWIPEKKTATTAFGFSSEAKAASARFYYVWPELAHDEQQPAASPEQIIACIRAFKTMTPPANDGDQSIFSG